MRKKIFHTLLLVLSLCLALGVFAFAACGEKDDQGGNGGQDGQEDNKVTYTVTLSCEDSLILNGINVQIKNFDGTVVGEQGVKNGPVSFSLDKGTYTVDLAEKAGFEQMLDDYVYGIATVTAESPSATIEILPADSQYEDAEKIAYRVTVLKPDNTPYVGASVQLCGGPLNVCNNGTTDESGVATFSLPAGDYDVHIRGIDGYTFDETNCKMGSTGGELTVTLQAA